MMEHNTILLIKASGDCSSEHDTILGKNASPQVLKVWDISQSEDALNELKQYRCKTSIQRMYCCAVVFHEEVYALQYCYREADGSISGDSDYVFAEGNKIL